MRASGFKLYVKSENGISEYTTHDCKKLEFSISEQKSGDTVILRGYLTAKEEIRPIWLDVMIPYDLRGLSFNANGFQSWSESPLIDKSKGIGKLASLPGRMFRLRCFGDYHFNRRAASAGTAYSHLYLDMQSDGKTDLFLGDLKPHDSYTMFSVNYIENMITASSDLEGLCIREGESVELFAVCIVGSSDEWFSILNIERLGAGRITGWTSWYNYYTKITEYILEANMKALHEARIPMDIFQIDDGYFANVGDWLEPNGSFPGGMKALADEVRSYGWTAGIWSAPFVTDNESSIFKEHSGWILRTNEGKLQPAGWNPNWTGVFYALDIYNEELRDYLREVYSTTIDDWGYGFLKLDFLYAAGLQPREGKTRCMVMSDAMDFLLESTNGAKILACGVPIGPVVGKCHYCRIGGDISHGWEDRFLKTINYRERVSTVSSLGNTKSRYHLNGKAFLNDPDVFILRDTKEIKMSEDEKQILFDTNLEKSGLVFFSDDISMYTEEKVKMVREAFTGYKGSGGD
ncbi:MAG: glycoside hydrolase family 36 protein [Clostridia bacterium]|nr:glycoside hydrolase family 36 protein [Clostridia bacterium]